MHAVFELVEHEMIFFGYFPAFMLFFVFREHDEELLGNKAEEMKLNFNLFFMAARALLCCWGFSRLTFVTRKFFSFPFQRSQFDLAGRIVAWLSKLIK
jgi:hypothetical protein